MKLLTKNEIEVLNGLNIRTIEMRFGDRVQEIIRNLNADAVEGSPVNAVNAGKVLTISGVVKHAETVSINNPARAGVDVYEFLADAVQKKTLETNIAVDITAYAEKASGTLTIDTQPTSGDTATIGGKIYTFVPDGTDTADGEISIGIDLASAQANIVAAINGTDGVNTAHPLVYASTFNTNVCTITALIGGTAGNAIGTTETFTAATNVFGAVTLETGTDCSAANAILALISAINTSDTQGVGAADGVGDTVEFTADVAGTSGNAIEIGETLTNGAFADNATKLSGGVDGTLGVKGESMIDALYIYIIASMTTRYPGRIGAVFPLA